MAENCRNGVCDAQVRRAHILHNANDFSASCDHPFLSTISNIQRKMRPALCVTYTMSDINAKPSRRMLLMYAWRRMLIFAVGSSIDSFTGMGTRSANLDSSIFSS